MSDSKRRGEGGSSERRNLPSWMSSKDKENKSHGKKAAATSAEDEESKLMVFLPMASLMDLIM